jgi:hypothetical protein
MAHNPSEEDVGTGSGNLRLDAQGNLGIQGEVFTGGKEEVNSGGGPVYYAPGGTVNVNPPASTSPAPARRGFVPPARADTYIPRGEIESLVRGRLAGQGVAAVVGVHAPGGVGKSELAKSVCRDLYTEFDDVFWLDVGEKTPSQLIADLAVRCGVALDPNWNHDQHIQAVHGFLGQRRYLVVLDDVRAANAATLAALLPPCAVLVTGRVQNLAGVPASATFALDRMSPDQARQLLESILTPEAVRAEESATADLAERCRYNPLALDIAARRVKMAVGLEAPIRAFEHKLKQRLAELKVGGDPRMDLEAVLDLSYADLEPDDQRRLRQLAVFAPSGFGPGAARAVWGDAPETASAAVVRLHNLSLLAIVPGATERYRLHDLLDEYAGARLGKAEAYTQAQTAHAGYLLQAFSADTVADLSTAPELGLELDNLRAATEHAANSHDGTLLARLATIPANWYRNIFRNWDEWEAWLKASRRIGIDDQGLEANALTALGDVQQFRKELDAAVASYTQALGLYRAVGARLGEANVIAAQSRLALLQGDRSGADGLLQQAVELRRIVRSRYDEAIDLQNFAATLLRLGEKTDARQFAEQAKVIFDQIGEPAFIGGIETLLAACEA